VDEFELEVTYNDQLLLFPCTLMMMGYTHKIQVLVNGITLLFEPDEEKYYRAVSDYHDRSIDIGLLKAIASTLEVAFK
jgi:hypothetical protein